MNDNQTLTIREWLGENPLLLDGAFGTYYPTVAGQPIQECELANLQAPLDVALVHRHYIRAGANAIRTNTFSANRRVLDTDGETLARIISAGIRIAREEAGDRPVIADIGPIYTAPGDEPPDFAEYCEIVDVFIAQGVRNYLFETFGENVFQARLAERIREQLPDAFIICSFESDQDGLTSSGENVRRIFEDLGAVEAIDALGLNCGAGPHHTLETMKRLPNTGKYFSMIPNTGYPEVVRNMVHFPDNKAYYAEKIQEGLELGAAIIGGCCGTNPDYIRLIAQLLEDHPLTPVKGLKTSSAELAIKSRKSSLLKKMERGERVVIVEYDSPKEPNIKDYLENARRFKTMGVDAITIADNPIAKARMDASYLASRVKNTLDLEVIPHFACRDRNLNATKGLLLGLNADGVDNILVVTGDPVLTTDREKIKSVFNFTTTTLLHYIMDLNTTLFDGGFTVGCALNVNSVNFDIELKKSLQKEAAGAVMHLTQPILSPLGVANLAKARQTLKGRILGGIYPITGHRNAQFMANELTGCDVDPHIVDSFRDLDPETAPAHSYAISTSFIDRIRPLVDGFYIVMPFARLDLVEALVRYIHDLESNSLPAQQ